MAYERQNFKNGQVLTAECLNKIDEWLKYICNKEVTSASINSKGELILCYCDGTEKTVGSCLGADGYSPVISFSRTGDATTITITDKSGIKSTIINDGAKGDDGTSVTVTDVSESSADGGNNVVTFSDGNTLTVKNGSKGNPGENGVSPIVSVSKSGKVTTITITDANGTKVATINDGADGSGGGTGSGGADGIGIASVAQTTTSTTDNGINVITVTLTNGATHTFEVRNGSKGSDGKTPVKGTDYYTDTDKNEMVDLVLAALPTWSGGSY